MTNETKGRPVALKPLSNSTGVSGERMQEIHRRIQAIRDSEEMGVRYMQLWEEQEMARLEGLEEGREKGRRVVRIFVGISIKEEAVGKQRTPKSKDGITRVSYAILIFFRFMVSCNYILACCSTKEKGCHPSVIRFFCAVESISLIRLS